MAPIARANSRKLCGLCRRDFPPSSKEMRICATFDAHLPPRGSKGAKSRGL